MVYPVIHHSPPQTNCSSAAHANAATMLRWWASLPRLGWIARSAEHRDGAAKPRCDSSIWKRCGRIQRNARAAIPDKPRSYRSVCRINPIVSKNSRGLEMRLRSAVHAIG